MLTLRPVGEAGKALLHGLCRANCRLFNANLESVFQRLSQHLLHTLNLRLKRSGKCFWHPGVCEGAQVNKIYGLQLISSFSTGAKFSIISFQRHAMCSKQLQKLISQTGKPSVDL